MNKLYNLPKETLQLLHKDGLLQQFIKAEIMFDLISQISIKEELRQQAIGGFLKKKGCTSEALFEKWLLENHHTRKECEDLATLGPRFEKYSIEAFGHKAGSRFLERKNELDIVVYSIIRVKDFFLAREIFFRIQEKEASFGDMAAKHSEGMENKTRGLVGPAPLGRAHPKLVELIKQSKIGEINSPIQIDEFNIVLRLEYYEPAKLDSFMKEKMSEELFNKWIDKETDIVNNNLLEKILVNNPESNLIKIS